MIKSDHWIKQMARDHALISPYIPSLVRFVDGHRTLTYGLSSYGYDIRLAQDGFRLFSPIYGKEIDPKRFDEKALVEPMLHQSSDGARYYLLPPYSYGLGLSVETFSLPRNVIGICVGKSTYARAGLLVNTTPLEAGWRGRLVIELANLASLPLRIYVDEGIAQVLFFESDQECLVSYADRAGKYQDQKGLTCARV